MKLQLFSRLRKLLQYAVVVSALSGLSACSTGQIATPSQATNPHVILVGDSTMVPRTGYGDALCQILISAKSCTNLARGGRSSKSYRIEGLWDEVLKRLYSREAGASVYVLIQFGHNDQPGKPDRSTDLAEHGNSDRLFRLLYE